MFNFVNRVMDAAKQYTLVDYAFFKFLMITFGIMLGVYYTEFIKEIIWVVRITFLVSAVWIIVKIFKYSIK